MGQNNRKTDSIFVSVCPEHYRFQNWDILASRMCSVGTLGYSLISPGQTGVYDHLVQMNLDDRFRVAVGHHCHEAHAIDQDGYPLVFSITLSHYHVGE